MLELIKNIISIDMLKTVLYYTEIFFVVYMLGYSTFLFVSVLVGGNQLFEDVKNAYNDFDYEMGSSLLKNI